jgi:Ulp1 family protease
MEEEIEVSLNNVALRKSDILTFQDYHQLNDLSISFYFEILNEKFSTFNNEFILLDPATVFLLIFETDLEDLIAMLKLLNLQSKQYIFIPVNDTDSKFKVAGGNHWALLIYQKSDQTFYYVDSMLSFIKNTNVIVKNMCEILGIKPNSEIICFDEEKQQQNTYDCGMFVLSYVEALLNRLNISRFRLKLSKTEINTTLKGISQSSVSLKRKEILKFIDSVKTKKKVIN